MTISFGKKCYFKFDNSEIMYSSILYTKYAQKAITVALYACILKS